MRTYEQHDLNAAWETVNMLWHSPDVSGATKNALSPVLVALAPYRNRVQARYDTRTIFQDAQFYESEAVRMAGVIEHGYVERSDAQEVEAVAVCGTR